MTDEFVNELGNSIRIHAEERGISGVQGVFIEISGPTSSTTLHITRAEAEALLAQLKHVLEPRSN
jgi:hypothetical protein